MLKHAFTDATEGMYYLFFALSWSWEMVVKSATMLEQTSQKFEGLKDDECILQGANHVT